VSKQCVHDQFLVVNVVNTLICYEMLLKMTLYLIYILSSIFCLRRLNKISTAAIGSFRGQNYFVDPLQHYYQYINAYSVKKMIADR